MSESKKIIAALLLTAFTALAGCIIVDCSMAEMTKERPYTLIVANQFDYFAKNCFKSLLETVKEL